MQKQLSSIHGFRSDLLAGPRRVRRGRRDAYVAGDRFHAETYKES